MGRVCKVLVINYCYYYKRVRWEKVNDLKISLPSMIWKYIRSLDDPPPLPPPPLIALGMFILANCLVKRYQKRFYFAAHIRREPINVNHCVYVCACVRACVFSSANQWQSNRQIIHCRWRYTELQKKVSTYRMSEWRKPWVNKQWNYSALLNWHVMCPFLWPNCYTPFEHSCKKTNPQIMFWHVQLVPPVGFQKYLWLSDITGINRKTL